MRRHRLTVAAVVLVVASCGDSGESRPTSAATVAIVDAQSLSSIREVASTTTVDAAQRKISVGRFRDYFEQNRACMAGACTNGDESYPPDPATVARFAVLWGVSEAEAYDGLMFSFVLRDYASRLFGLRDAASAIPGEDVRDLVAAITEGYDVWAACAGGGTVLTPEARTKCLPEEGSYMAALEDLYFFTG